MLTERSRAGRNDDIVHVESDERAVGDVFGSVRCVPGDIHSLPDGPDGVRVRGKDRRRPHVALFNLDVNRGGCRSDGEGRADVSGVAKDYTKDYWYLHSVYVFRNSRVI